MNIQTNEVHIWQIQYDNYLFDLNVERFLSPNEKQEAERFIYFHHKQFYKFTHAFLRMLLGYYLKIETTSIMIFKNNYGKPYLKDPNNLKFNLSHSENFIRYALTRGQEIGIDVEWIEKDIDWKEIAVRFFNKLEYEFILSLPTEHQKHWFYRIWVRKEAYLKASGYGLSIPLSSFSVLDNKSVIDLPTKEGYISALSLMGNVNLDAACISYFEAQKILEYIRN